MDSKNETLLIGFKSPVVEGNAIVIGVENPKNVMLGKEKPCFSKQFSQDNTVNVSTPVMPDVYY